MAKLYNLARMTTATTGTGTITLGSAVSSYLSFAAAGVQNGDTVTYAIADGNNREVGRGVYTSSGTTLTRAAILESTNNNLAINLSGNAEVFITAAAEDIANVNETNTFTANQIISVTDNTNAALRVTQLGTGNAILVEDSSNPDSTPFVVNASGNVGIGTTAPAVPLDISGNSTGRTSQYIRNLNTTANSASELVLWADNNTEYTGLVAFAQAAGYLSFNNPSGGVINVVPAQPLAFWTNNTERFRFGPAGQLGIAGANYGTSGQSLISGGSGTAPSWGSPAALSTASGSAPSYSARAWVNFNGTGTVSIRASGNVTSITDNGTGDYTINFTTAMSDANYAVMGSVFEASGSNARSFGGATTYSLAAGSARISTNSSNGFADYTVVAAAVFR
jgi:hypothetical protein